MLFRWFKFQSGPYDVDVEVEAKKGSKTFSLPVRTLRESGPMQLMFMHGDTHNTGWGEFAVSSQVKSLKNKIKIMSLNLSLKISQRKYLKSRTGDYSDVLVRRRTAAQVLVDRCLGMFLTEDVWG